MIASAESAWREQRAVKYCLAGLLFAHGVLWFGFVGRAGIGNPYYSAAIGTASESFRFASIGSLDPAGFVTIDKPPVGLWIPAVAVRILGRSAWVLILSHAAIVWFCCLSAAHTIKGQTRRVVAFGLALLSPGLALLARTTLVDASMILFGTVAMLVLLSERGERRSWVAVAGVLTALALLSKPGAILMAPALLWIVLRRDSGFVFRRAVIFSGSVVTVLAAWIVVAGLAQGDTWFGGSGDNLAWQQLFPSSTVDRLVDADLTGLDAQAGIASAGEPGPLRLITGRMGRQAGALVPLALLSGFLILRRGRSLAAEAWLVWLVCHAVAYSLIPGLAHAYYAASVVPAVVCLVASGGDLVVRSRYGWIAGLAGVAVSAGLLSGTVGISVDWIVSASVLVFAAGAALQFAQNKDALVVSLLLIPVVVWGSLSVETLLATREASFDPAAGEVVELRLPNLELVANELSAPDSTWSLATSNETLATRLIAEHQQSVMLVGGFLGRDRILTGDDLSSLVSTGEVGQVLAPRRLVSPADEILTEFGSACLTSPLGTYQVWTCNE